MLMKLVKPASVSERQTKTVLDTLEISPKLIASWKVPRFQREFKVTPKVQECADQIRRNGGVIPGVITLGVLDGDVYLVDGLQRTGAFNTLDLGIGYVDVRMHWFATMGEMAAEFDQINQKIKTLRPDDRLRAQEETNTVLQKIRRKCGYIGYDLVRRSEKAPVLSMSVFLRSWGAGRMEVPTWTSAAAVLAVMDDAETAAAIEWVSLCFEAWRRDPEYVRLWGHPNLSLCAWLYRRIVMGDRVAATGRRADRWPSDDFRRCLHAVSADSAYLEYLPSRTLSDPHRAPTYNRLKSIFQRRYLAEHGQAVRLPSPAWSHT